MIAQIYSITYFEPLIDVENSQISHFSKFNLQIYFEDKTDFSGKLSN